MSPQVKATLGEFSSYFSQFEDEDDFLSEDGSVPMCYEIDVETPDGGVIGRTLIQSGKDKYGNPMVRDFGEFEIIASGEIIKCDGISKTTANAISANGLKFYEQENF